MTAMSPPPSRSPRWASVALATLLLLPSLAAADGWKRVLREDGISVSAREVPGKPYLEFRGVGLVQANLFQILAILDDTPRHCDWQANCTVSRVVKKVNEVERYIYHRVHSPWPVSDRDVVVRGSVEVDMARKTVWSRFRSATLPDVPPVKGAVRMPRLEGFYKLEWRDEGSTVVTYQVVADTGGMLPTWLANRASRKLPLGTLQGMRRQAKAFAGRYEAFHKRYNPAFGGQVPPQFGGIAAPKAPATPAAPPAAPAPAPAPAPTPPPNRPNDEGQ